MKKLNRKGFTIIELVIVIAVIAILAAVMVPTFSSIVEKANESTAQQEATSYFKELYALDWADGDYDGLADKKTDGEITKNGNKVTKIGDVDVDDEVTINYYEKEGKVIFEFKKGDYNFESINGKAPAKVDNFTNTTNFNAGGITE